MPTRTSATREMDFPQALKASKEIVSLPMFPELTAEQVDYVATRVAEALA